jgi:hypothetical protein
VVKTHNRVLTSGVNPDSLNPDPDTDPDPAFYVNLDPGLNTDLGF